MASDGDRADGVGGAAAGDTDAPAALAIPDLARVVAASPVGLAVLDPDLRVLGANPAFAAATARPVAELLGRPVADVLPELDIDLRFTLGRVLETGEPRVGVFVRPATERRSSPTWELSAFRTLDAAGRVTGVAVHLTDATERQQRVDALAAAAFRLGLLDDAGARIGSTLDVQRTSRELLGVAIPRFADHAVVDLMESVLSGADADTGQRMRRVARAAADGWLDRDEPGADRTPFLPGSHVAAALAGGSAVLVGDLDDTFLRTVARLPVTADGAPTPPVTSAVLAPLTARGRVLGVAIFLRVGASRPFEPQDVALAGELAGRAALAMDNALLYSRERRTALTLQRSLLPQDVPELDGVTFARRYLPGSENAQVGGDWFDVVGLPGGRVALVVGDVMGRGVRAAAAMGQLRTAVRTLAVLDLMPEDLLSHLDDLAQSLDQVQLATCIYAVYDPVSRRLRYATAGHLPPALVPPGAPASLLELPSGAPLGVGGVPYESVDIVVPDGSRFVLYTDGLVESRDADIDVGLETLRSALDDAPERLDALCDALLARLGGDGSHDDDVAVVAARLQGLDADSSQRWHVASDLSAVAVARRLTRAQLGHWDMDDLVDTATLLVSELVTNAIRYAREPIELSLLRLHDRIEIAVADNDTRLPRLKRADTDAEGGRGLHLVGSLARRWGARSTPGGKVVWFELGLPGAREAAGAFGT